MTPILKYHNTEYTTKFKHSAELYDVALNIIMKTCSQLFSFKLSIVYQIW